MLGGGAPSISGNAAATREIVPSSVAHMDEADAARAVAYVVKADTERAAEKMQTESPAPTTSAPSANPAESTVSPSSVAPVSLRDAVSRARARAAVSARAVI